MLNDMTNNIETYWRYEEIVTAYLKDITSFLKIIAVCSIIIASYIVCKMIKKIVNFLKEDNKKDQGNE